MARKYKRKVARRKKFVPKKRSDAQVKKLAKSAMASMKPMKRLAFDAINSNPDLSSVSWLLFRPTHIAGAANDSGSAENCRMSNQIWLQRFSGIANLQIGEYTLHAVEIRKMCGFYKGVTGAYDTAPNSLTASLMQNRFPNRMQRYDPDNWKIIEDRQFSVTPKHVYDSNGSDDAVGSEAMKAVWSPIQLKCNFRLNKVFRYTDGVSNNAEEGLVTDGNLQIGWIPFFAIQVRCPTQGFTAYQGSNPSPTWDYKFTSYFKDNI